MSNLPKGGRGKQAPYETTHYRIPVDIKSLVEKIATNYKEIYIYQGEEEASKFLAQIDQSIFNTMNNTMNSFTISEQDVDQIAKEILAQKKNARISLSKFIKRVFGYESL